MRHIDKHFRISPETNEAIKKRDSMRFPLERDFVNEAILSYQNQSDYKVILEKIDTLTEAMDRVNRIYGWK